MSANSSALIRQKYRVLGKLIRKLPEPTSKGSLGPDQAWKELRRSFRQPLKKEESLKDRLAQAEDKVAFLKMITPHQESQAGRWVYGKDGKKDGNAASRSGSKVHTNWDGKNLDPCSVKQHNYQLKRMGFRNNAHAKGIF